MSVTNEVPTPRQPDRPLTRGDNGRLIREGAKALFDAEHDWWVGVAHVKIVRGKKLPSFPGGWQGRAVNNMDDFDKVWGQAADSYYANLWIDCGKSGIVVIDCDSPEAIRQATEWSLTPTAYTTRTNVRGFHAYYQADPGLVLKNKPLSLGMEIKVSGGLVFAPPSWDDRGQRVWANGVPQRVEPMPPALRAAAIRSAEKPGRQAQDDEHTFTVSRAEAYVEPALEKLRSAEDGEINTTALSTALTLYHFVPEIWSADEAIEMFEDALAETVYDGATWTSDRFHRVIRGEEPPEDDWKATLPKQADVRFEHLVSEELERLRVREEAKRRHLGVELATPPPLRPLTEMLAEPEQKTDYRVDRLWPLGGSVILAAQAKAGKTTMRDNLIRSLVDGDPFLGEYKTEPVTGTVVVLDLEMPENAARRWFRDQHLVNTDNVVFVSLRGRETAFDLFDEKVLAEWTELIQPINPEVVILDCLSPWLSAFSMNEMDNTDVGRALQKFRELVLRVGASESFVIHHMGHTAERTRGASVLQGWPDALWRVVLHDGEKGNADQPRYFGAYGRDVAESETLLEFDTTRRHLTLDPERKDRSANRPKGRAIGNETPAEWVGRVIAEAGSEGVSSTGLRSIPGKPHVSKHPAAIKEAEKNGWIKRKGGSGPWVKGDGQTALDYGA